MPDQKTVKIPAQGAELESWLGLADISDLVPQGWSLAGGSMMRLLACERGYEGSRATRDIDVVLNNSRSTSAYWGIRPCTQEHRIRH